ncbi:deacetylase complex subunit [Phlyctema vagabunda]|uniref:Deacetylase complex subunit n=1 Tax=Phlyctema vagabunda TaxID=108571 RepID=A0ABR4PY38_9HELO
MAMSPSPQLSPDMGGRIALMPSPPPQQSKRDKKRAQLADRLTDITTQFSANRDAHCRQELLALQVDLNLISESEVPAKGPLPDRGEDIRSFADELANRTLMKAIGPIGAPERAGKIYSEFAAEVNDAIEQRDTEMTTHKRNFDTDMAKLEGNYAYRRKLAELEHKSLSSTLRDRLINSLNSKKARLSRDKETIEITESNALLLHPSQYSILNPDSPGGPPSKRATRHRRELEDVPTFIEGKRKRKAADSDESPAPIHIEKRPRLEPGTSTPVYNPDRPWRNERAEIEETQVKSSIYSMDKLFTDKELALTYNNAAQAAHTYMVRHAPYADSPDAQVNGINETENGQIGMGDNENEDGDASPVAMERQYSHATRSTRNAGIFSTGMGVDHITDLNYPYTLQSLTKQIPKLPPMLTNFMQKAYVKGDTAVQPAALSADEVSADLDIIRRGRTFNDDRGYGQNLELQNGGRHILEHAVKAKRGEPHPSQKPGHWIKGDNKELLSNLREELGDAGAGFWGEPMSKQSSRGASEMGGTPMSRQGTGDAQVSSRGRKGIPRLV